MKNLFDLRNICCVFLCEYRRKKVFNCSHILFGYICHLTSWYWYMASHWHVR